MVALGAAPLDLENLHFSSSLRAHTESYYVFVEPEAAYVGVSLDRDFVRISCNAIYPFQGVDKACSRSVASVLRVRAKPFRLSREGRYRRSSPFLIEIPFVDMFQDPLFPANPRPSLLTPAAFTTYATLPIPDYVNTLTKTTQWKRPTQRVRSTGGPDGRPQVVDAPIVRRGSNASSAGSLASLSGATNHHHDAAAVSAAVSSPPDADAPAPPLRRTPTAPSYRTAVLLSNSAATAAAAGGVAPSPTAGAAEVYEGMPLPPNWHKRTTEKNK